MTARIQRPHNTDLSDRLCLTLAETAQALGVNRETIRRLQARGDFPKAKIASVVVVPVEALVVWLRTQTLWNEAPVEWTRLKSLATRWGKVEKQDEPSFLRIVRDRA